MFSSMGCVQIVPAGSPGSVALLETCDVTGHIVYTKKQELLSINHYSLWPINFHQDLLMSLGYL